MQPVMRCDSNVFCWSDDSLVTLLA